jgi:hypothetical protein
MKLLTLWSEILVHFMLFHETVDALWDSEPTRLDGIVNVLNDDVV